MVTYYVFWFHQQIPILPLKKLVHGHFITDDTKLADELQVYGNIVFTSKNKIEVEDKFSIAEKYYVNIPKSIPIQSENIEQYEQVDIEKELDELINASKSLEIIDEEIEVSIEELEHSIEVPDIDIDFEN